MKRTLFLMLILTSVKLFGGQQFPISTANSCYVYWIDIEQNKVVDTYFLNNNQGSEFFNSVTFDMDSVFVIEESVKTSFFYLYVAANYGIFKISFDKKAWSKLNKTYDFSNVTRLQAYASTDDFREAKRVRGRRMQLFEYGKKYKFNVKDILSGAIPSKTDTELKREAIVRKIAITDSTISSIYDQYVKEKSDYIENESSKSREAIKKLKRPLFGLRYSITDVNSVGGVDLYISFVNNTGKRIKYINYTCKIKNRVGDFIKDEIRGSSILSLKAMGSDDDIEYHGWEDAFYNGWADELVITNIQLVFYDGTTLNYNAAAISDILANDKKISSLTDNQELDDIQNELETINTLDKARSLLFTSNKQSGFVSYFNDRVKDFSAEDYNNLIKELNDIDSYLKDSAIIERITNKVKESSIFNGFLY